ncbi:uncharacterized protein LOC130647033 [Hydractinia symbiolongicarpus]|uniref:uncharacterized protein LOC130647033 n=1 Tax=Hydractinia symbiolongicarpus TaxID=13093 RepID=UPI00254B4005|nr:uncharacterized protein LOC130647033 [Hydractinia symbiolongicarpus]
MQYQRTRRIFNLCQLFMNVKMANVLRFCCEVFLILVVVEETLGGCTQDGSTYKCKSITHGKTASLKVTWLKCRPPKITVQLIIEDVGVHFQKEFDALNNNKRTDVSIPGESFAGLYVKVQMLVEGSHKMHVKIDVGVKETVYYWETYTVFDENVDCSGLGAWWDSRSSTTKTFLVVCIIFLIMTMPSSCWLYRRVRMQRRAVTTPVGSPVQMAEPLSYTTSSNLPYSKLEK